MGLGKTMIVIGLILANQVSFIDLSSIVNGMNGVSSASPDVSHC